jgi:SagB-type dehydrogenase family enzyme
MPAAWQALSAAHRAPGLKYLETLFQRRSRRNFVPAPLDEKRWSGLMSLIAAAAGQPASPWVSPTIGILAGEQTPVSPGFYLFDTGGQRLGQMISGPLIDPMAAACLDQMWLKHAAIHLLFISDPAALERGFGARAYRHVMIEAGRLGQQAYLAATALGLGACGIGALYDREAADLLQLPDDGTLLYLVGMGPVKSR